MNRTTPDRDPAVMDLTRRTALASRDNLRGQFPIERLTPALYFTADMDGDELLVSDRCGTAASPLHHQIEALAGAQLVRRPDCDSDGVLVLGFSADAAAGVLERLDRLDATSGETAVAVAADALWEPRLQTTGHRCEVRVHFLDVDDNATEPRA